MPNASTPSSGMEAIGRAETIVDHRRIVQAIGAGDPVSASLATTDHLSRGEASCFRRHTR